MKKRSLEICKKQARAKYIRLHYATIVLRAQEQKAAPGQARGRVEIE